MSKKLETFQGDIHFKNLKKIITLEGEGYGTNHTSLILSQLRNFDKGKPRWDEKTIRECVLLNSVSPKGYRILRERKLLQLPSKTTLHRYIGPVSGEVGITTLVTKRLTEEAHNLLPEERFVSLIIDEMAIKPQCIYDKKLDCFLGAKTKFDDNKDQRTLANRLLCFVLHGLSTAFTIPCAYYFTRQLTGKELYTITQQVLFAVEGCGYSVVRIVTDNYKTNVSLFKNLSKGNMKEAIIHPLDSERQLFLSFDQNHIIKNIRSLFLEREMFDGKEIISSKYVKLLYRFQSRENVKAVRNLTIKHIDPSNFEKMNVARAVAIFSPPVVAALELLKDNSLVHPKATDFKAAGATITFLRNIYKWFSIHDVHNRHEHIHSRLAAKMHFFTSDDERLLWLEDYFLPYLNHLRESCFQNNPPFKFLSDETYEAIQLTTKSTVGCIRYLLHNGYHYVLTRHFNSDSIESFFSSLRQMSGANDMLDVRATLFSLEKILKTGVASSVCQQNPLICCTTEKHLSTSSTPVTELPEDVVSLLDDLRISQVAQFWMSLLFPFQRG